MRKAVFSSRLIVRIFTVILAILIIPVIRFGFVPDRIDYSFNVPHNGGILAAGFEVGNVRQWQSKSASTCCDRDPARDLNALDAAGNTWPIGIWSDRGTLWVADNLDKQLYAVIVRYRGRGRADSTTLQYYRSWNASISRIDSRVGTEGITGFAGSDAVDASITLMPPFGSRLHYYGACVEPVAGVFDTDNNCSRSVIVTVTSPPPFAVELVFLSGLRDASHQELFRRAALRWMSLIAEDIPDVDFSGNPFHEVDEDFGMRIRVGDVVDDLRIYAGVGEIDGKGRVLGHARPVIVDSLSGLPKIGLIEIDKDDISSLFESHLLATIIHEIGHVLGFGTLWVEKELLRGDSDLQFTGPLAIQAFDDAGGRTYGGQKVPVESDAAHWRQSVFGFELMTRSFPGGRLILSAITIQSLADLGYRVNVSRADEYRLPEPAGAKPAAEQFLDWGDCVPERPVYVVDENGRVIDVIVQ